MKKSRLIALTLVVSMMLMGTAYAAWTQTLNVDGTVATGKLEATVEPVAFTTSHTNSDEELAIYEPVISQTGDFNENISITSSNYYPGIVDTYTFEIKNTGTIPMDVQIDEVMSTFPWAVRYQLVELYVRSASGEKTKLSAGSMGWNPSTDKAPWHKNGIETRLSGIPSAQVQPDETFVIEFTLTFADEMVEGESDHGNSMTLEEMQDYNLEFVFDVSQFNID